MSKLLVLGWYQTFEIEREQRQDELLKLKNESERQERLKHEALLMLIKKGECDA